MKSTGTLYVCGFSEILADLKLPASRFFQGCKWLVWHYKNKANLGADWGRSHESLLHLRKSQQFAFNADDVRLPYGNHTLKYPEHPQAETSRYGKGRSGKDKLWRPHPKGAKPKDVIEIPMTCNKMHEKTSHPTQKPAELWRKIVLASSNSGDLVIDPFLGSGTTAVAAEQLGRKWKGCDISLEYCRWAVRRIELVEDWPVEKWIQYDLENADRRDTKNYIELKEIHKVVYTVQQAIGSVGDSFDNPNQSRKRVGQLCETLVKLIIQAGRLECEPRTIHIPIPGYPVLRNVLRVGFCVLSQQGYSSC